MKRILAQAVDWYVRLHDTDPTDATRAEWQAWLNADPLNAQAWKRIEQLQQRFGQAPSRVAAVTIEQARLQRRAAVKMLAAVLGMGVVGWRGYEGSPWSVDYSTRVGQRSNVTLLDGSLLILDTDSRVDVQFDAHQRLIVLRQGAICVQTGKDPRPLHVQTAEGSVRALGTRFSVRQGEGITRVSVEAHAVEVRPRLASEQAQRAEAGQEVSFSASRTGQVSSAAERASAWTYGILVVIDWRLEDLLVELSRYRIGYLNCAPEVAGLRLSGTFLLDDSEGVLANLEDSLPVRVRRFTHYWVRVEGRNV